MLNLRSKTSPAAAPGAWNYTSNVTNHTYTYATYNYTYAAAENYCQMNGGGASVMA